MKFGGSTQGQFEYGVSDAALDSSNRLYITGRTDDPGFPAVNGPTNCCHVMQGDNAFFARVDSTGSLLNAFPFGGDGNDAGNGIAVSPGGVPWITGSSDSASFPNRVGTPPGGQDAFIARVNFTTTSSYIGFSRFIGGSGTDSGKGIAIGSDSSIYVTGGTDSKDLVLPYPRGTFYSFLTKHNSLGALLISKYSAARGEAIAVNGAGTVVVASGNGLYQPLTITRHNSSLNVVGQQQSLSVPGDTGTFSPKIAIDANGYVYASAYVYYFGDGPGPTLLNPAVSPFQGIGGDGPSDGIVLRQAP